MRQGSKSRIMNIYLVPPPEASVVDVFFFFFFRNVGLNKKTNGPISGYFNPNQVEPRK